MKKYKTLFSFSFRDYGESSGVWHDGCKVPVCMGASKSHSDMATYCRSLAAYLLEISYNCDHAKDFCAPEYDQEEKEKQLEKLRDLMLNNF